MLRRYRVCIRAITLPTTQLQLRIAHDNISRVLFDNFFFSSNIHSESHSRERLRLYNGFCAFFHFGYIHMQRSIVSHWANNKKASTQKKRVSQLGIGIVIQRDQRLHAPFFCSYIAPFVRRVFALANRWIWITSALLLCHVPAFGTDNNENKILEYAFRLVNWSCL